MRSGWTVPDSLWELVEPILPPEPPRPKGGRRRVPNRRVFAGILYRLSTGCQWKAIPRELCTGSTCHRRFTEWVQAGVFEAIWARLLKFYDERKGIDWTWSALDGAIVKAPKGGRTQAETRPIAASWGPNGMF